MPERRRVADDLRRFSGGGTILARPESVLERSWRWCRRPHPWPASAACFLILVGSLIGLTALYVNAENHANPCGRRLQTAESSRPGGHATPARGRRTPPGRSTADAARKAAEEVKRQQNATEIRRRAAQEEADRPADDAVLGGHV